MQHKHHQQSNPLPAAAVGFAVLIFLVVATFLFEIALADAFKVFDLSVQDVRMILVFFAVFPLILLIINRAIVSPYLLLTEEREQATAGADEESAVLKLRTAALNDEFEARIMEVRVAALEEKLRLVNKAKEQAQQEIQRAESEARRQMQHARLGVAEDVAAMRVQLRRNIEPLAAALAARIKGLGGMA